MAFSVITNQLKNKDFFDPNSSDILNELNALKLEKLYAGMEVIDLSMINPDIEPPRFLLDKLVESALHPDRHRYAVSRGVRKLREAFSYKYKKVFSVDLDPEKNVCTTMGSKEGVLNVLTILKKSGAKALVGAPTYSAYTASLDLCGIPTDFFHISSDEKAMLEEIDKLSNSNNYTILLLNFPNNPTGVVVSYDFYCKLYTLATERNIFIINDFVYGEMSFESSVATSLLNVSPNFSNCLEFYSLSKSYSVPGWRVAAACGNQDVISALARLQSKIDYGIFLPLQDAASAALISDENLTSSITNTYNRRCRIVVSGLRKLGWHIVMPKAGASVWAEIPAVLGSDGDALAWQLLNSFNIMVLPGSVFGAEFKSYIRFALVASEDRLQKVLDYLSLLRSSKDLMEPLYANL